MKITDEAVKAIPERIFAKTHGASTDIVSGQRGLIGGWSEQKREGQIEFIRFDIAAALPYLPAGYKVKQLEWEIVNSSYRADSDFGAYIVREWGDGAYLYYDYGTGDADYPSIDEAKAAAQADFERRVRECIEGNLPNEGAKPVDVASLDLSVLETLSEKADEFDIPDDLGPWPDIQDAMITVGDLRKVRRLLKDFQSLSATSTEGVGVRRQALEEEEFALKVAEEMIVARDRRIKELEGQLIKKAEECAVLANSLDVSAAPTEEEEK